MNKLISLAIAAIWLTSPIAAKAVDFTVPATGTYQILAFGAQGGNVVSGSPIGIGGNGAEIGGDFTLAASEVLKIAVGGAGGDGGGALTRTPVPDIGWLPPPG